MPFTMVEVESRRYTGGGRIRSGIGLSVAGGAGTKSGRLYFSVSIGKDVMAATRLVVGDDVRIGYDPDAAMLLIARTADGQNGVRLSPSSKEKSPKGSVARTTAKFKVTEQFLATIPLSMRRVKTIAIPAEDLVIEPTAFAFKVPEGIEIGAADRSVFD